jgi:hypothetical protein
MDARTAAPALNLMDALASSLIDNAFALVALLWFGSVGLLAYAVRGYVAARAVERAAQPGTQQEPFIDAGVTQGLEDVRSSASTRDGPDVGESFGSQATSPVPAIDEIAAEDQRLDAAMAASRDAPGAPGEDLLAAVSDRLSAAPGDSQGLRELVRALYLDQSNFRFETLAALGDEDRRLAMRLIEAWIADPSALDFWHAIYAALDIPARSTRAAQHA